MKLHRLGFLILLSACWGVGCGKKSAESSAEQAAGSAKSTVDKASESGKGSGDKAPPPRPAVEQIKPSMEIKTPPADAVKLASGMLYKKLTTTDGPQPGRNDTVVIHFTGWKAASGETFNTTRTRGNPMPLDLSTAGPGFAEAFTQLHKGEKAMLWMPPELVAKNGQSGAELLAFEAELVDIQPAPPVPPDVAAPPAGAKTTARGLKYVVVTPGTGTEKARFFDTASFRYTMWDATGKMLSSTEKRSRPVSSALYRQPLPIEDIMTTMVVGQRTRFWVDAEKLSKGAADVPPGQVCEEITLLEITKGKQPPPTPKDVKAPPAGTKKTAAGVSYRVLKAGKGGAHPKATDTVSVHYTGWTTDGRMFDSSVVRGEPTKFPLNGVIQGWTDGIPLMAVGETTRFWIPEELAYKGAPNNPQGMLVFDVELLEILPPAPPGGNPHGMGGSPHGG
jgi:FKBP-type peptidyl-prolyl cis-trans isomerase